MRRRQLAFLLLPLLGLVAYLPSATADTTGTEVPFEAADLTIEVNATDGDAGLQVFLDHEAWRHVRIYNPAGERIFDFTVTGPVRPFGLTELFSESSEPPFTEFPLARFKELFPEGDYTFWGRTVEGTDLRSRVPLTHDIPRGPNIVEPEEDAELPRDGVLIRWEGVTRPVGIDITGYEVIVSREDDERILDVELGPSARRLRVPKVFLQHDTEYKVEVLAVEASGNQTLTEVPFFVE